MHSSVAFCPGGISSFFEPCTTDRAGNLLTDPIHIGARGGGFALARGVTSRVTVGKHYRTRVEVRINSKPAPYAHTTRTAIEELVARGTPLEVLVDVKVSVPIAAGFGTSAAGTLASCLALADAANLPVTLNEIGTAAHVAEVVNSTGLGTVAGLLHGGFALVREPGAPGIGLIDRLRFPADLSIVCGYLGQIQTREVLTRHSTDAKYAPLARRVFEATNRNPNVSTFLAESREFGKHAGFETPRVGSLISTMLDAGALGAAQNMIGEAVHAVAEDRRLTKIINAVKRSSPQARVFASRLDNVGVRILQTHAKH